MKKQKHYTKEELNRMGKMQREALDAAAGSLKIINMVILYERHGYDAEMLHGFIDDFEDVLTFFNNSDDYQKLLREWNDFFYDYAGIRILPGKGD